MMPSFWQILIAVVILILVFGSKRIPELGKSLGEAIRGFRKGIKEDQEDEDDKSELKKDSSSNDKS